MNDLLNAVILGIVEGLTEFLPVSSTGHLIISEHLLGLEGAAIECFMVFIQLGAILAVVLLYWGRFWGLLFPRRGQRFSGLRGIILLMLTSLPASILGLLAHSAIKAKLFSPIPVALALAAGAILMLAVEARKTRPRYNTLDDMTPALALGIGFFQCLSLWPGFSRSASTIMGGMLLGGRRELAAEYSFLAAVPIMFAATGFDLYKNLDALNMSELPFFALGFVVAFFSALLAVKVFIKMVSRVSLRPFAWYRLALAPLAYYFFSR